jgi:hypothetical protein
LEDETMLTTRQTEIADIYATTYPRSFTALVARAKTGDSRACKALGDNMARVAYPASISGPDALEIAKIGMDT